ncbi:hypothetical protein PUN28_008016 [Cardiocondyla obscurior]|uniref:Transmembrane protein n=1 Tax=Cardiocondyla obscurior TaxID=286306 RepID=A0AAW2FZ59_9HYME
MLSILPRRDAVYRFLLTGSRILFSTYRGCFPSPSGDRFVEKEPRISLSLSLSLLCFCSPFFAFFIHSSGYLCVFIFNLFSSDVSTF